MDFGTELGGDQDFFQMFWPTIISHKIGKIPHIVDIFYPQHTIISQEIGQLRCKKLQLENGRYQDNQFSDEESPLYEFSARDISSKMQFEIILTMEGITPETGNTIQVWPHIISSLAPKN